MVRCCGGLGLAHMGNRNKRVFWGPTLLHLRRARLSGDTVFWVAHRGYWLFYAAIVIVPPLLLTLYWYRYKAI
jgi:hypothetical protein